MATSAFTLSPDGAGMVSHVQDVSLGSERHRLTFEGPIDAPAILWLDGGMGYGELGSLRERNGELFEHFLVAHDRQLPATENASSGVRVADLVADVGAVIDLVRSATGGRRIVLVGHSVGAALSLLVAAERQDALAAYVGVNQPVGPVPDALLRLRLVLAQAAARGAVSATRSVVRSGPGIAGRHEADDLAEFAENVWALHRLTRDPEDLVRWAAANEASVDLEEVATGTIEDAAARTWQCLADFDALAHVPPLDIRSVFIAGRHDPVVPLASVQRFVDAVQMPGWVRLVVLEDSGHFAYWEQADAFNAVMLNEVLPAVLEDQSRQRSEPSREVVTRIASASSARCHRPSSPGGRLAAAPDA